MNCHIEQAHIDHIPDITKMVRLADREEIWASSMQSPERVMQRGLVISDFALTGFVDETPVLMWGVVIQSFIGSVGTPWMVGTEHLDKVAIPFLRRCRAPVMALFENYDKLQNHVDARNVKAIQWLKWLGFKFEAEPRPYGYLSLPFYKFWMEKDNV